MLPRCASRPAKIPARQKRNFFCTIPKHFLMNQRGRLSARALAMVHLTIFDAVNAIDRKAVRFAGAKASTA